MVENENSQGDASNKDGSGSHTEGGKAFKQSNLVVTFGAIIILVFLGTLYYGLKLDPNAVKSVLICKKYSDIDISMFQGQNFINSQNSGEGEVIKLSSAIGKPMVLNFWASWCVSCRSEAFVLEKFWQEHKQDNVLVLGVAVEDELSTAQQFARQFRKNYPLGLDHIGQGSVEYGVIGVPETFYIDIGGNIVGKTVGPVTPDELEKHLEKIKTDNSQECGTAA